MKLKKLIAMALCAAIALPLSLFGAAAAKKDGDAGKKTVTAQPRVETASAEDLESVFADGENSIIVFVTGIGQSFSYLFDESYTEAGAFENGTLQDYENYAPLIAEGAYKARWNLFNDFTEAIHDKATIKSILKVAGQLLGTLFLRRNLVKEADATELVERLFSFNLVDENGDLSERLVTPRYACPVADYPGVIEEDGSFRSEAKQRFYTSIPCMEAARKYFGENYEDYLYCFNYSPFSFPTRNVSDLHDYIETVLAENRVGAEKVVLIPMSMGATVVSAYLAAYPEVEENHVRRVVSIVGGWNGSDLILDLINKTYPDNSPELLYNGIVAELVGEPWGYVVNLALRLFSKQALRDFIDEALGVFVDVIFLRTPSLMSLVPDYAYADVRPLIGQEHLLAQTDFYYAAQSTLRERLAALEEQGVTFSFIAAYGLPYGAITKDYKVFGFMRSAETTNSDEIINISSAAPGTKFVSYNRAFEDTEGRVLSPEGSLDISGAYYKDSTWYFYQQKHELEYNNTAISLAMDLALGKVKTVADCDEETDAAYYPQFNGARDVRDLQRDYIPAMQRYLAAGGALTDEQAQLYADVQAMLARTVNDPEADNALIAAFRQTLLDLGLISAPGEPSKLESLFTASLRKQNDLVERIWGPKGYLDWGV